MSVERDAAGRRSVRVEIEVPGAPDAVWRAVATGPGVSAWFVPTEFEANEDGVPTRVVTHFGPGFDSIATTTGWEPPRRLTAESQDLGANAPSLRTEWSVEPGSSGTCVVRVIHSVFASGAEWDAQLRSFEAGWPWFLQILKLYLAHFAGQPCATLRAMGFSRDGAAAAWDALKDPLGLVAAGGACQTSGDAPPCSGFVERNEGDGNSRRALLRLAEPAPGLVSILAQPMGGQVALVLDCYLYGPLAAAAAKRDEPAWQAWMSQHFPSAG